MIATETLSTRSTNLRLYLFFLCVFVIPWQIKKHIPFITPELKEYENKVLNAEERIKTLEYELFIDLRKEVAKEVERILRTSAIISDFS